MDEDDLSYSFYTDKNNGYIDSEDNIINNFKSSSSTNKLKKKNIEVVNSPPDPIAVITKRSKERWTEDSAVNNCQSCNTTFRIYRRRHHCILEGTPVTLSDGTAVNIENVMTNTFVTSYNSEFDCIQNNKIVDTLFDQGYETCYKIVLEDGREIVATSDHRFLSIVNNDSEPKYVELKKLNKNDKLVCSSFVGISHNMENNMENLEDLAFSRLAGFFKFGKMEDLKGDDLLSLERDLKITENNPQNIQTYIPKTNNCKREYIAAFFGNRKLNNEIIGYEEQKNKILEAEQINDWINELEIPSVLEITNENDNFIFDYSMNLSSFAEKIGVRYSFQKSKELHLLTLKDKMNFQNYSDFLKYIQYDEERGYYSLKIKSISLYDNGKPQHVYDLSVPGNVSFVAQGIVVHNCKNCGNIFCDSCSLYRSKIPKVIKKIPTRTGKEEPIDYNTEVRLCLKCFNSYNEIHKLEKLFTIFSLLRLNLYDFKIIACVSKQWNMISAFYMSKFREIQYKMPKSPYNSWEKQALWTNRYLLKQHSIWETHVLRSLEGEQFGQAVQIYFPSKDTKNEDESLKKVPSFQGRQCWNRMCSRYCRSYLDPERALLLLDVLEKKNTSIESVNTVAQKIAETFNSCLCTELECYLPFILHKIVLTNNEVLRDFIFSKCENNLRIANCTYWFLKMNSKVLLSQMVARLSQDFYTKIIKTQTFVESVSNGEKIKGKMISVVCPEYDEQDIYTDKISIKESATRPTLIPCSKGSILYKKDDVRKDYIIICVIRLMEKILKENGLNIDVVTYNVQPTCENEGFIQIVDNCETLYNISEKLKISLINYLLNNNPDESVSVLRQRFKNSCAIQSVLTFLLSISDRNSENLMLTRDGNFFNIDFGYCLGSDPKPLRTSCIRITHQMLEALGGENSSEYIQFKELCGTIYDILRRHVNTFVCLLSLIPTFKSVSSTSPNINEEQMMIEIIKRFCPGESYDAAISNLKTRIDNSADNSTLTKYHVIDFFHKMNKEKTVTNYLNYGYTGGKAMLSSMYSYLYSFT